MRKSVPVLLTAAIIIVMTPNSPWYEYRTAPVVETAGVRVIDAVDAVRLRGTVVELRRRELYACGPSVVDAIHVMTGQRVEPGQPIMTLHTTVPERSVPAFYRELQDRLASGDTVLLDDLSLPYERPSGQEYRLLAPIGGVVMEISASVGETTSGVFPCAAVSDLTRLGVMADAGEESVALLTAGLPCTVRVPSLCEEALPAHITAVAPFARSSVSMLGRSEDPRTGVSIAFDAPDGALRPGYSAEVSVTTMRLHNIPVLPYDCIEQDDAGEYVYAIRSFHLEKKYVVTGRELAGGVELLEGLDAFDTVVREPGRYREGSRVRLK